jgi:Phosphotransferase enzyme family
MSSPSQRFGRLDSAWTDRVLAVACRVNGLDSTGARLVQREGVADYSLPGRPVVVRLARNADASRTEVAVARWLESHAFPATRLASMLQQLQVVEGLVVSWWNQLDQSPAHEEPGWVELASMLRRFQQLPPPPPGTLPPFDPLGEVTCWLDDLPDIVQPADARFLRSLAAQVGDDLANLRFELGSGPILGGPSPGHLVRDAGGAVQLIDFSQAAWGAREWDAVSLASGHRYFNQIDRYEYLDTVAAYGWDPLKWPGHSVVELVNDVCQTIRYIHRSGAPADIAARIGYLRQRTTK